MTDRGVGKFRVPANGRQFDCVERGQHRRYGDVRLVGVPAVIADRRRGAVDGIALSVEIRNDMSGGVALRLPIPLAVTRNLTKVGDKRELLLSAQHLVGEYQNMTVVKCRADLLPLAWRQRSRQIEAGNGDSASL